MEINFSKYFHLKRFKLALALVLVLLTFAIMQITLIEDIESRLLDYRFRTWTGDLQPDSSIVIISIDNGSLDYFAQNDVSWPWPRSFYAHLVEYMDHEGAGLVIFDMLFTHSDADRSETDAEQTDGLFASAIGNSNNVVLGTMLENMHSEPDLSGETFLLRGDSAFSNTLNDSVIQLPIQVLMNANPLLGHTNIKPDHDGIFRHTRPFLNIPDYSIPSLAMAAFLYLTTDGTDAVQADSMTFPLNSQTDQLICWYGGAGPEGVFPYMSFQSVIQSASAIKYGGKPSIPSGTFKNKIVIVGADAAGLRDLKPTPILQNGLHPGMEIWATVLSNYLQSDYLYDIPAIILIVILSGMSFLILLGFDRLEPRYGFLILISQMSIYVFAAYLLWSNHPKYMLPLSPAILISLLSYLLVFSNEMREKLFLKRVFGPYIAPELMELMYQTRESPALGGQQVNGSAFFSDLQGFTKFSEKLSPTKLVSLLNEYLTDMTDSLMDLRGTLDKYEGDAIIAFFGAPVTDAEHAHQAVKAAIAMQQGLSTLRKKWDSEGDNWPPEIKNLQMRIGINSGEMLVGNVGSKGRMNFTMMGDTVNVAARLESSAKQYGVLTHISEATARQMPPEIILRRLGATRLVGKANVSVSYEVFGYAHDLTSEDHRLLEIWPNALEAVEQRNWDLAIKLFKQTLSLERRYTGRPTNPSEVYLKIRIPGWQSIDPDENWSPVWVFESK